MVAITKMLTVAIVAAGLALSPLMEQQAQAKCAIGAGAGWGTLSGAVVGGFTGFFIGKAAGSAVDDASGGATGGAGGGIGGGVGAVVGLFGGALVGLVLGIIVGAIACSWGNSPSTEEGAAEEEAWLKSDGQLYAVSKRAVRSLQRTALVTVIDYQFDVYEADAADPVINVGRSAFDAHSIAAAWGHKAAVSLSNLRPDFGGALALPAM